MESDVSAPIEDPEEVFEIIASSIGYTFSLEELIRTIEGVFVNRPIYIKRIQLPPHITGRTYNLRDAVVIQLNASLDRDHAQCVCCHEIGHIVFNHVEPTELSLQEFITEFESGRIDQIPTIYRQHKTVFDHPWEQIAEDIGVLFIEAIERWESTLPDLAQDIYGID